MTNDEWSLQVRDIAQNWMKDDAFRIEYEALEDEFALARALIGAREKPEAPESPLLRAKQKA